ncbi:ribose 5-phosphate isomerase B [Gloeobacter violaceus]|uniref:Ribose 5-phosphate epimerase n=1 Tax=Gloeobacter violaceus (strain ATCC 29082 / PCC 7421) TaxID=251221 RepID=Q7NJZ3_GLOVI|nr:ribose 5-phosphate isomerase B [Gloeobacter violaceus]BAC89629.1 ribose 5-phosphate epimerase [Gloeobacter violaceus PCC 7421]
MKLVIGSDHGAYELKEELKTWLGEHEYAFEDVGTYNGERCDYPLVAQSVAEKIQRGEADRGILLCGTGIGISIAANKFDGIRAALAHDHYTARMSREHNDANVLAMGGRVLGPEVAKDVLETWLSTEFGGERHQRRLDQIQSFEAPKTPQTVGS